MGICIHKLENKNQVFDNNQIQTMDHITTYNYDINVDAKKLIKHK